MINLTLAIKQIQKEIDDKTLAFNEEIAPLTDTLESLHKVNEACLICEGRGKVLRSRACAEDDRPDPNDPSDWIKCPFCHGTGRIK